MLNRHIDSIIYQSYLKLGELAYILTTNSKNGLEATREQKALWNKAIYISSLLDVVTDQIELQNGVFYRLIGTTVAEMNQLLACLKDVAEIYNYPVAPFLPGNLSRINLGGAFQGAPGANGSSSYIAVGFAESNTGTNFTSTPTGSTTHVAFKASTSPIVLQSSSFTGLWIPIAGVGGEDGTDGVDGESVYPYVRYAADADGTDFSATPDVSRRYVAFLLSSEDLGLTPIVDEFLGLFTPYIGTNGTNGIDGVDGNTIICGSTAPDNALGINSDVYLDTTSWIIYAPKSGGVWPVGVSIIGATGPPGADGANGIDGVGQDGLDGDSIYMYIAYSESLDGNNYILVKSNDPTAILAPFDLSKQYIAILTSTTRIGDVIVQASFTGQWTRYKGDGDRWSSFSTTSLTIALGNQLLLIEKELAYTTGQLIVIAKDEDPLIRMEGLVISYNPLTGQLSVDVAIINGAGTFTAWDVNLQAGIVSPPSNIYGGASPTNITVGGLAAGSSISGLTYDAIIEAMTQFYYSPAFTAFAISGQAVTVEVGTTVSGSKTFTWSISNIGNVGANNLIIRNITGGSSDLATAVNATLGTLAAVAIGTITKTTATSHVWRVLATDTHTVVFQRDFTVNWYWMKYIGTSTNTVLTEAQIEALAAISLSSGFAATYALAAGGYKYFVWDDALGSPTATTGFKDTATNLAVDMADVTDHANYSNIQNGWSYALVSVTNAQGVVSNKRVYRTRNILGGAINIIVS